MRTTLAALLLLVPAAPAQPQSPEVTLELIMSDPDWIGNAPERPYWAADSKSVYYTVKRQGSEARDLIEVGLDGKQLRVLADADKPAADPAIFDWNDGYTRLVYSRHADLFLRDLTSTPRQLTRTSAGEGAPRFLVDGRIAFTRDGVLLIHDPATGHETQPADLRAEDDPEAKKDKEDKGDYLRQQQERLFDVVKERKSSREAAEAREESEREADTTRLRPIYLGANVEVREQSLSPDARWLLVRTGPKGTQDGKRDTMPQYVTDSGYVETRQVRSKVGTSKPTSDALVLIDLTTGGKRDLDLAVLPGIADDPSEKDTPPTEPPAAPPAEAGEPATPATPEQKKDTSQGARARPVSIDIRWSDDGSAAAIQVFSHDNKDRWIARVDLDRGAVIPLERDHDPAWIQRGFTRLGWLRDSSGVWFLSERDGYSGLYIRTLDATPARRLFPGEFEVFDPDLSRDGKVIYYTASADRPTNREFFRVDVATGRTEQLTRMGGNNSFELAPDESAVLITHSTTTTPPDLYIQPLAAGAEPARATRTATDQFAAIDWTAPQIVQVPSRHGRPIYSRLYKPDDKGNPFLRPAVVFVHGAGYLQNAHEGWSQYFREFMFHTLLTRRGYVVLDMDYRASAGYGRDWRTAIYSRMGTPELEDLEDGVAWLVKEHGVDPARVGVYGGSYGGFLTLMAMFQKPDLFACGAALRPVTDWAHYSGGYTDNILDTPQTNPDAYARSSPIEFAAGLRRPLLICHGMQDDNVFFQDTVRLTHRLIELEKDMFTVAFYPVEPHAFTRPSSWLDEYRRILRLFEENLE